MASSGLFGFGERSEICEVHPLHAVYQSSLLGSGHLKASQETQHFQPKSWEQPGENNIAAATYHEMPQLVPHPSPMEVYQVKIPNYKKEFKRTNNQNVTTYQGTAQSCFIRNTR